MLPLQRGNKSKVPPSVSMKGGRSLTKPIVMIENIFAGMGELTMGVRFYSAPVNLSFTDPILLNPLVPRICFPTKLLL